MTTIKIEPKQLVYLLIVLITLVVFLAIRVVRGQQEIKQFETNIRAMNDTLKTYQLKNGKLISEKSFIYSSMDDLKNSNKSLYDSVKYYQKKLKMNIGSVETVFVKGEVITKYDTVFVDGTFVNDSTKHYKMYAENKDSVITTNTNVEFDLISKDSISLIVNQKITNELIVDGLKITIMNGYRKSSLFKPNEQYVTAVTTNDKRFTISNIQRWEDSEGYKKKPFISIRPGIFTGIIYDPFRKEVALGVGGGLTIQVRK